MIQITSLLEIEELAKQIIDAKKDYSNKYEKKLFLGMSWDSGSCKARNETNDKHNLHKEIEITPELASFLAQDQTTFDAKSDEIFWKTHPLKELLLAPTSVLIALIIPSATKFAVRNAIKAVQKMNNYQREYDRIWSERNQTVGTIMSIYLLKEATSGKYVLQRAEWYTMYYSVSKSDELSETGVDSKMDKSKLPALPPTTNYIKQ